MTTTSTGLKRWIRYYLFPINFRPNGVLLTPKITLAANFKGNLYFTYC